MIPPHARRLLRGERRVLGPPPGAETSSTAAVRPTRPKVLVIVRFPCGCPRCPGLQRPRRPHRSMRKAAAKPIARHQTGRLPAKRRRLGREPAPSSRQTLLPAKPPPTAVREGADRSICLMGYGNRSTQLPFLPANTTELVMPHGAASVPAVAI